MPHIVGDRFLASGRGWVDLATGHPVRLRILSAGSRVQQAVWTDSCDTLARLRHPLLNPLLDYGAADSARLFEAYAMQPPKAAGGAAGIRLLQHAVRFLELQGVQVTRPLADFALRAVSRGERGIRGVRRVGRTDGTAGRLAGIVLQHRRVMADLSEALDGSGGGPVAIEVCGGAGSGLTTLRVLAARAARLCGYAPICAGVLTEWPWVADALLERYVCVLMEEDAPGRQRAMVARLLARLGVSSARAHALVAFRSTEEITPNALRVGPLGVTAMASMVYIDEDYDTTAVFQAARAADGRPGLFLRELNVAPFDDVPLLRATMVHETAASYVVASTAEPVRPGVAPPRRTGAVAAAASAQAVRLADRGRHGAAVRLLSRASRVLHGRGDAAAAAAAALQLGWLLRERGQTQAALQQFERARTIHSHEETAVAATLAIAVCWTDEARLHEAEAAARAAVAAVGALANACRVPDAVLVLARVLFWLQRAEEASAVLGPALSDGAWERAAEAWALSARVKLLAGDTTGALAAAREARRLAASTGRPRLIATASRAAAAVSTAIGDLAAARSYVEEGLTAARRSHAPLVALRIRAVLVTAFAATAADTREAQRAAAHLRRAIERPLPALLRWQLRIACDAARGSDAPPAAARQFVRDTGARALLQPLAPEDDRRLRALQRLLELCHSAADDRTALERLCAEVCERLHATTVMIVGKGAERRRLAIAGRQWPGEPHVAFRALEAGIAIRPHASESPAQAAEPVAFGGEIVAALCCRWTAGAIVNPDHAAELLRLGALAAGASVRTLLDAGVATPPDQICPELLGASGAAAALREAIRRAARAPFPVLIEGESGTGKELVARAIHRLGPRRDRRFCAINCAAISDDLLEAELFGHARGAFTGAVAERAGLFEEADGGTLFLDEVGELSARAQAKLLRVLQDGEVRRVGENFSRRVDARLVAATNRQLEREVTGGRFRGDLRFRLDVVRIEVPPLRDRAGDIPLLAAHFWHEASARVGSAASLAPDALATLARYDWPGNVRELQNAIASMAVHAPRRGRVTAAAVPPHVARVASAADTSFDAAREDFERRFLRAALARANGHRGRAAQVLGLSRQGLAKMMKRLGIGQGADAADGR